jgi:hypothetical protein
LLELGNLKCLDVDSSDAGQGLLAQFEQLGGIETFEESIRINRTRTAPETIQLVE